MTDLRQAMLQAVEALDSDNPDIQLRAAVTLRAALAAPQLDQVEKLKAERDAAMKLARDYAREAYEDVEGWSAYASDHFQRRWNLEGDLAKWLERGAAIDDARNEA